MISIANIKSIIIIQTNSLICLRTLLPFVLVAPDITFYFLLEKAAFRLPFRDPGATRKSFFTFVYIIINLIYNAVFKHYRYNIK